MKYLLIIFLLPFTSKGQVSLPQQDSVGYVQPWLNERGQVVWMNTMMMDIRNVEYDTLFFRVEFQFPAGQAPYSSFIPSLNLRFEPTQGLPCYAIKNYETSLWDMYLPNNQPIETLLLRGFKTTRIVQTGQK